MPDCPQCGTWNPDDKIVCWRCQTELPRPKPQKKRTPMRIAGLSIWVWLVLVLVVISVIATQCFLFSGPISS